MAEQTETAQSTGAQTTETSGTAQESAGLPQFQFQHWAGQIGYLLILFVILYVLMARVFAPRIRKVFEARRETIEGALSSARQVQAEAAAQAEAAKQSLAGARAKAQKTALDAKAKAAAEAAERQGKLEAELNAKLSDAEARIAGQREQALGQVRGIAAETAAAIVEKLTGIGAPEEAVNAALAEVQG